MAALLAVLTSTRQFANGRHLCSFRAFPFATLLPINVGRNDHEILKAILLQLGEVLHL